MRETMMADISVAKGVAGDARGHFPNRQITLLFEEAWIAACADLGRPLPWTTRRANILIGGMSAVVEAGVRLSLADVVLEVAEETSPCNLMEKAAPGLRSALKPGWRGGVCCRVISAGTIAAGDAVRIVPR